MEIKMADEAAVQGSSYSQNSQIDDEMEIDSEIDSVEKKKND